VKFIALIAALTFSTASFAQTADAPVATVLAPVDAIKCYDAEQRANIVKAYEYQKARADSLEKEVPNKTVAIVLIVSAFVLGAGLGIGVTAAVNATPAPK